MTTLPDKFGNTPLKRLVYLYSLIWKSIYGFAPTIQWGKIGKLLKPLYTEHTEWQIAAIICLHFDWHGATGDDDFVFKKLSENCFPFEWLPVSFNAYRAYIVNTLGIDWNDKEQLREFAINTVNQYKKK
jgi:hypothetical protein